MPGCETQKFRARNRGVSEKAKGHWGDKKRDAQAKSKVTKAIYTCDVMCDLMCDSHGDAI
jgi:ribosomal protein L20